MDSIILGNGQDNLKSFSSFSPFSSFSSPSFVYSSFNFFLCSLPFDLFLVYSLLSLELFFCVPVFPKFFQSLVFISPLSPLSSPSFLAPLSPLFSLLFISLSFLVSLSYLLTATDLLLCVVSLVLLLSFFRR